MRRARIMRTPPPRLRTGLLSALAGAVIAAGWLRLEQPQHDGWRAPGLVAAALAPAWARSPRLRALASLPAIVFGLAIAFSVSPLTLWPDGIGFFRPVASQFADGVADFYAFRLPIDPAAHEHMHMVLLAAVFAFTLLVALAVAARAPLVAVVVFLVGAGWPATLLAGGNDLGRGAVILAVALALLAGLSDRAGRVAVPAAGAVVLAALALSTSAAVAKNGFLDWQHWNPYAGSQKPVGVSYVWNGSYEGVRFPRKVTKVLSIDAPKSIGTYWRATVLDVFAGDRWIERPWRESATDDRVLAPPAARDPARIVRQSVTVDALRDRHLVGASMPVAYRVSRPAAYVGQNVAVATGGLEREEQYSVLSYVADPSPEELVRVAAVYPPALTRPGRELDVAPGVTAPPFGAPGRNRRLELALTGRLAPYARLLRRARAVTGDTNSPYAAIVALERWLRIAGGFTYSPQPPRTRGQPPLVSFVLETRIGYCQHFAGAMALMARLLGIPARVAAGFVTGRYADGQWTVTDHDAHAWVEVWFRGYGWLPFDPTPGRGTLAASYSSASRAFDAAAEAKLLSRLVRGGEVFGSGRKARANAGKRGTSLGTAAGVAVRRRVETGRSRHPSLVGFLALLALGLFGAIVVTKIARRRLRYLTRDPRRVAAACGRELHDFLVDQRFPLQRKTTFRELAAAVSQRLAVDARPFADAAEAARYGPPTAAPDAARRARRELRELKVRLRRHLFLRQRARGLASLRSLGF